MQVSHAPNPDSLIADDLLQEPNEDGCSSLDLDLLQERPPKVPAEETGLSRLDWTVFGSSRAARARAHTPALT